MRIIMCVRQLKLLTSLNIKRRHGIWIKHRNRDDQRIIELEFGLHKEWEAYLKNANNAKFRRNNS